MCVGYWRILHFTFSIFHSNAGEVALRYDLANVGDAIYAAGLVIDGANRFVEVGAGTREVVFQRVHPYDWDMDGIPNSIDDTPREPSPNTGYNQTDAWAMAAFPSNSAEIATMGYAAWVAAKAAEPNHHLVSLAVTSPKGAWPVCLSVDDKQVMCDGKAELKFVLDDGAKYWFSLADGELGAFSVLGTNGVETAGWLGWGCPFETTVGGVTLHLDSPSEGWMGCLANVGITLDGREVADFGRYDDAGGIFNPGNVDWRVVLGPGRVVSHVGLLATVVATADEGTVTVEARFNEDEIQPRFVLPIVRPRVIPVRAFVAPPPRTLQRHAWRESDIRSRFGMANDIFSQVGITFDLLSVEYNFCSETNWNLRATRTVRHSDGSVHHLITDQMGALLDHYQANDCIEVYFLGNFSEGDGDGICNIRGLALARNSRVNAFPHELGHVLGLNDCYAYVRHEISGSNTWTFLPDCHVPVKQSSLVGRNDWGAETGRGFYEHKDTHRDIYEQFLMFGVDLESIKDIPDGRVFSLKDGAETTNDVWYAEIGAEGIKTNNVEVYTQ